MKSALKLTGCREKRFLLTFTFLYILWMILYAKFESMVKWAYGTAYWLILFGSHFIAISIIVYVGAKHLDKRRDVKRGKLIRLGLILGGIVIMGFMLEDFCSITFAGLFSPVSGVNGSVAGIPFQDPHYGYYVEPIFSTGYLLIGLFKVPWAYIYLSMLGLVLIVLGLKMDAILKMIGKNNIRPQSPIMCGKPINHTVQLYYKINEASSMSFKPAYQLYNDIENGSANEVQ